MNQKQIKELLKAHCTKENGRWVFKQVDIDAASLELEQAFVNESEQDGGGFSILHEDTFVWFLLWLYDKGLINNYDFDFEKVSKDYIKSLKTKKQN